MVDLNKRQDVREDLRLGEELKIGMKAEIQLLVEERERVVLAMELLPRKIVVCPRPQAFYFHIFKI